MKKSHYYWSESILSYDSLLGVKQKYVLRYVFFVDSKLSNIYDTLTFSRQLRGEILFTTVRCYCCSVVVAVLLMVWCGVCHTTTLWFLDIVWSIMITDTRRRLLTMMRRCYRWGCKKFLCSVIPLLLYCWWCGRHACRCNFLVLFGVSYYDHRHKKKTINDDVMLVMVRSKKREELTAQKYLCSTDNRGRFRISH